jgi:hypothetical protein
VHRVTIYKWCRANLLHVTTHHGRMRIRPTGHWFTTEQLGNAAGYSRQWIWVLIDCGRIKARMCGRRYMIPLEEARDLIVARVTGNRKSLSIRKIENSR